MEKNSIKIDIPFELFTTFNNVKFLDKTHQYFVNYKQLTSVTTFLHKFQEKFDENKWSLKKAEEYGMTQAEVLADWKSINKKSTLKGSIVHNYIENLFLNKIYDYPYDMVIRELGEDNIKKEFDIIKNLIDDFYQKTNGKLIPIKLEFIVYDEAIGIAGMMDGLFFNIKAQEFQIYDWKTNKEFKLTNNFQTLKTPLSHLDDSHMNLYSLQTSMYKFILNRKIPNLKIGKCFIVWFNEKNSKAEIMECYDYTGLIPILL